MLSIRLITDAVLSTLQTGTGKPIGDHNAPRDDAQEIKVPPYGVLFCLPGGNAWGPPLYDSHDSTSVIYQVTSVGSKRNQCEWMSDKVRSVLLARTSAGFTTSITATGIAVVDRDLSYQGPLIAEGEWFNKVDQFTFTIVPTT